MAVDVRPAPLPGGGRVALIRGTSGRLHGACDSTARINRIEAVRAPGRAGAQRCPQAPTPTDGKSCTPLICQPSSVWTI
jgi:hypothetical protein